jgi:hypothetical protein
VTCQTCGGPLNWWPGKPGVRPKFCSDKCRKASYGGTCIDCGARTDGSNGRDKAPELCRDCDKKQIRDRAQARWRDKNDRLAELYLAGVPLKGIAAEMGLQPNTVAVALWRLRNLYGYELPHRRADFEDRRAA